MMDTTRLFLLALALLASALIAGFFYAYQVSVMPGLAVSDPMVAIAAMQAINSVIRTSVFAFSFFGTLGFGLLATLASLRRWRRPAAILIASGTLLYGGGGFAVTFLFNIPLNDQLAVAAPTPETAAAVWGAFFGPWMAWNAVRTAASILAFAAFCGGLWCAARERARS